jgi:Zn ribbon nucleic-acid-binding protein
MRVKHHAQGKFYVIECPEGTRLVRRSEQPADGSEAVPCDHLVVPLNGKELRIPADPPELLPMLAESGNFGISLVGEPLPDVRLAGVVCPKCSEDDVNWLQVWEDSETVHCDRCGTEFAVAVPTTTQITSSRRAGDKR